MKNSQTRSSGAAQWLLVLALLLVANSAYLAAFGDPSLFYVANALLHPVLGIVAAIFLAIVMARHRDLLGTVPATNGRRYSAVAKLTALFLALAIAFGIYLLFAGMTRPHSLALYVHVGASMAGLLLLLLVWRARARRAGAATALRNTWRWTAGVASFAVLFYVAAAVYQRVFPDPKYTIHNPSTAPLSMEREGAGEGSLAFPSSARTADGKTIPAAVFPELRNLQALSHRYL